MMRFVAGCLAAVSLAVVTGCSTTTGPLPAESSPSGSPTVSVDPVTVIPRSGVIYLRAWAATDVPTMIAAAVPGSPAWNFAQYWNDAYRAGRLDTGPGWSRCDPGGSVCSSVLIATGSPAPRPAVTDDWSRGDRNLAVRWPTGSWRASPHLSGSDAFESLLATSTSMGRAIFGQLAHRRSAPDDLAALRYQPGGAPPRWARRNDRGHHREEG